MVPNMSALPTVSVLYNPSKDMELSVDLNVFFALVSLTKDP